MKIGIDALPLKTGHKYRGIGIYTQNLLRSLNALKKSSLEIRLLEKKEDLKKVDLVHYPYFDLFWRTLPLVKQKATVVTIHDVIPLVFPEFFPKGIKGSLKLYLQKVALKGVKRVITDSENSRKDIFKYLNYPLSKIEVVYLAHSSEFKPIKSKSILEKIREKYHLPEKFILYVGDVNYNKNVLGLVKAFSELKKQKENKGLKLILVGKAFKQKGLKETRKIKSLIDSLGLKKEIKCLGWVENEDLVGIYNLASVYCQPSFYEGFGLPVLEAMACGTPVVSAKTASLPEIASEAAIMIDPYNINSLVKALDNVLNNPLAAQMLSKKGLQQAEKFSWEKTAQKTYEVYQKVVQEQ